MFIRTSYKIYIAVMEYKWTGLNLKVAMRSKDFERVNHPGEWLASKRPRGESQECDTGSLPFSLTHHPVPTGGAGLSSL